MYLVITIATVSLQKHEQSENYAHVVVRCLVPPADGVSSHGDR